MRRGAWVLADQVIFSAANFLLIVLVARQLTPAVFGAFAVLYGYYVIAVQLAQAAIAEPLLVRAPQDGALRDSSGAAAAFGLLAGVALLPVSMLLVDGVGPPVLIMAALLPALLVQDALRMGFIATGRPRAALANDVFRGVAQCLAVLAVLGVTTDLTWLLAGWGTAGVAATGMAIAQARVLPRPSAVFGWMRRHGDLARPYLAESVVLCASTYAVVLFVGRFAGMPEAGALRAAETLFGPANILLNAGRVLAIAELARVAAAAPDRLARRVLYVAVGLAGIGAVAGTAVMALPGTVGTSLFGDLWDRVVPLLPVLTICRIVQGATTGPEAALRALEAVPELLCLRVVVAAVLIVAGGAGAVLGGAVGATLGLAASAALCCSCAVALFVRNVRATGSARAGRDVQAKSNPQAPHGTRWDQKPKVIR